MAEIFCIPKGNIGHGLSVFLFILLLIILFKSLILKYEDCMFFKICSFSDFGTMGRSGVRKNEDYIKNYFVDRYGAIKNNTL